MIELKTDIALADLARAIGASLLGTPMASLKVSALASCSDALGLEPEGEPASLFVPSRCGHSSAMALAAKLNQPCIMTHNDYRVHAKASSLSLVVQNLEVATLKLIRLAQHLGVKNAGYVSSGARVHPTSVIGPNVTIGEDVVIGPHVVLGASAFVTVDLNGRQELVPSLGQVRVETGTHIIANASIASALVGTTRIGECVMIDAGAHVGHDAHIASQVSLGAHSMIGGYARCERMSTVGAGSSIAPRRVLGEHAAISPMSAVVQNVKANSRVTGVPAINHMQWLRQKAAERRTSKP